MKTLAFLGLLFVVLTGSALAQDIENCPQFANEAISLLDDARTAIEADDKDGSLASITEAQDKLAGCNPDNEEAENTSETDTSTTVSDSTTLATDDEPTGNFIVNTPEVNPEHSISFLRFSNWSPDSGNLDFYMGTDTTPIVENIAYQEFTNFVIVNGGNLSITARPAGSGADGEALSQLNWEFQGNSSWMVSSLGLQSKFAFLVEPFSIMRNDYKEQARVRIVNLIATRQNVTVNTDSDVILTEGLGWVGVKDIMLDPNIYTANAQLEDGTQFGNLFSQEFQANNTYLVVLTGMNTEDQPVQAFILKNPENLTRVKFVSSRSDAVEVYLMPDALEVVDQLEPNTETDWISLPSGALSFVLFAPDSGPTSQELAGISRQLGPGRDVTINVDDMGLHISEITITQ